MMNGPYERLQDYLSCFQCKINLYHCEKGCHGLIKTAWEWVILQSHCVVQSNLIINWCLFLCKIAHLANNQATVQRGEGSNQSVKIVFYFYFFLNHICQHFWQISNFWEHDWGKKIILNFIKCHSIGYSKIFASKFIILVPPLNPL